MFVFCSAHKGPFPQATTPLSMLGRYLLVSVLFLVWLTFLIGLVIGVPATPGFLAWFTRSQLWLPVHDLGLEKEAKEVLVCLILVTIFLMLMIWGAVPAFAMSRVNSKWGKTLRYAVFGGMIAVLTGVSVRSMYLTWNWARLFEAVADDARLAGQCKFITSTLGILLCSGYASIILYLLYTASFGTPTFIQQMLDDCTYLLCSTEMRNRKMLDDESGESMRKSDDA